MMHDLNLLGELLSLHLTEALDWCFSGSFHLPPTAGELAALHSVLLRGAGDVCYIDLFFVVLHCISQRQGSEYSNQQLVCPQSTLSGHSVCLLFCLLGFWLLFFFFLFP